MTTQSNIKKTAKKILAAKKNIKSNKLTLRERKITNDINSLINNLYNIQAKDEQLRYDNLKTYRIEIIRGFIVYAHLAIEEILKYFLVDFIRKQSKSFGVRKITKIVDGFRSADIIEWCLRFNLITKRQYLFIKDLNRIRNSCAHNWILDIPKYKKIIQNRNVKWIKTPIVRYNNKNLFNEKVFSKEFLPNYGSIYIKLLDKNWRIKGYI